MHQQYNCLKKIKYFFWNGNLNPYSIPDKVRTKTTKFWISNYIKTLTKISEDTVLSRGRDSTEQPIYGEFTDPNTENKLKEEIGVRT